MGGGEREVIRVVGGRGRKRRGEKKKNLNRIDGRGSGEFAAWQGGGTTLAAGFIDSRAADVPHPFDDIMVTVVELGLKHLQVAHLQAGWRKRNLQGQRRNVTNVPKHARCRSQVLATGSVFMWK